MKLSQLKESVHDHDHFFLLQKVAVELGYQRLQLHDSSYQFNDDDEDGKKFYYDAAPDIDTAIAVSKLPLEDMATAWNSLQRLQNLRQLDDDDINASLHAMKGPLIRLRGVEALANAYKQVEKEQNWVRTSAKNVMTVLMLLNDIKTWAKKEAERGSEESYKVTIAKTTLKKLGIPLGSG